MQPTRRSTEPRPFVYVGVRPFFPATPVDDVHPQAVTRAIVTQIADAGPGELELRLFTRGFDEPYASEPVRSSRLLDVTCEVRPPPRDNPVSSVDATLEVRARCEDPEVARIMGDHRDLEMPWRRAYEHRSLHWGTENWGGLSIELWIGPRRIARHDVDAFTAEDDDLIEPRLVVFALCEGSGTTVRPSGAKPSESSGEPADDGPAYRCPSCGARGRIDGTLFAMVNRAADSIMLAPCEPCGARLWITIHSAAESGRSGYQLTVTLAPTA